MAKEALEQNTIEDDDDRQRSGFDRNQRSGRSHPSTRRSFRGGYRPRRKVCLFCADKTRSINWKEADSLRRFINDGGGIHSRRKTGTCARHQRRLAIAIKRARHMALLPYTVEHLRIMSKS
jgi:small subunit ribosomal protein S18